MKQYSNILRKKVVDTEKKAIRLTKISAIEESNDSNCYINCQGYGRLRKYKDFNLFLCNEIDGANKRLLRGLEKSVKEFTTQVFQIAGCNIRCWYCFVDDSILAAESEQLRWTTVKDMIDMYEQEKNRSIILDLSGGQPDLAPEWCYWAMVELEHRGLKGEVYVWLDDNLATADVLEKYLTKEQISYMAAFPKHSRACCFKGYDDVTVQFNACNKKITIDSQIKSFKKLYEYGFELYAYISLTGPYGHADVNKINQFICNIRDINKNLPLRIIPLKIMPFTVTEKRLNDTYRQAFKEQTRAYEIWKEVLSIYYSKEEMEMAFEDVIVR